MKLEDIVIIHSNNTTEHVVLSENITSRLLGYKELNLNNGIKIFEKKKDENINISGNDWYCVIDDKLYVANHSEVNGVNHFTLQK